MGVQNFGPGGIFSVFFVEIPGLAISGLCSRSGRSQPVPFKPRILVKNVGRFSRTQQIQEPKTLETRNPGIGNQKSSEIFDNSDSLVHELHEKW